MLSVYGLPLFEDIVMPIAFGKEFSSLPKEMLFILPWT
jgi:hypothetical protein